MKHEVKFKGTMPVCCACDIMRVGKECNGYDTECREFMQDDFGVCTHCAHEKSVFKIVQTNNVVFEMKMQGTYYEEKILKIGRNDYSDARIEYLEIDGIVLIDKLKENNTD